MSRPLTSITVCVELILFDRITRDGTGRWRTRSGRLCHLSRSAACGRNVPETAFSILAFTRPRSRSSVTGSLDVVCSWKTSSTVPSAHVVIRAPAMLMPWPATAPAIRENSPASSTVSSVSSVTFLSSTWRKSARSGTSIDRKVRPSYGAAPVTVGVSLYVLSVAEISEKFMDYTFDMYFRQFWTDERLKFQVEITFMTETCNLLYHLQLY